MLFVKYAKIVCRFIAMFVESMDFVVKAIDVFENIVSVI